MKALAAEGSFEVVASGGTADEAVACGVTELPDLIVSDLQMPGSGLEAVRRLYAEAPFVKSIVLSSDDSEHLVSAAYAVGAFGFLVKGQSLREVIAAFKAIVDGQSFFSPALARKLVAPQGIAAPWRAADEFATLAITPREEQILSRYAQGLTIEEIAESIGLRVQIVGAFLTNILHKLHEQTLFLHAAAIIDAAGT